MNISVWLPIILSLAAGFLLGFAAAYAVRSLHTRTAKELADELYRENEAQRRLDRDDILKNIRATFGNLSLEALSRSTEEFLKLAKATLESEREAGAQELETKKGLIDQQLQRMAQEMEHVSSLMQELEKDRVEKFGELAGQLKSTGEQTTALTQVTNTLREALASTKTRGQWGERMAEDILRIAGFIENINYVKQKTIAESGGRPDFTFLLPNDLTLNMDVKFPLNNYIRFLSSEGESDKEKYRTVFLRDVKDRIKEVATREYINPAQNTVDCVLLFIPNEQIYAFIHEQDSTIFEHAVKSHVIFCSPITLFAVIAVIRQAVENFSFTQTSHEILSLLGKFKKQWGEFLAKFELLGKRLNDAQKEYEALTTTRKRKLEKPLNDIEALRVDQGIPIAASDKDDE